jgi:pimeloyl-ACP methyl ester carboxylesterase
MNTHQNETQFADVEGGRIAYDVIGQGPLVVLSSGMADTRSAYRFLAPLIAAAGYTVANVDLRGHGASSTGWSSYTHEDTAGDLLSVIDAIGAPAVLVGHSFSAGAATLAAARNPEKIRAVAMIDPFTRPPKYELGALLRNAHGYRSGAIAIGRFALGGKPQTWAKYLDVAYPQVKPADWDGYISALIGNLSEPGRAEAAVKMITSKPAHATLAQAKEELTELRCPVLIVMGADDSDFPDPEAEALGIAAAIPSGAARHVMIERAGHYPHAQYPEQTAAAIIPFLEEQR